MTETDNIKRAHKIAREYREARVMMTHKTGKPVRNVLTELADAVDMIHDPEYNGCANYPTWAVNLWLSNDEPLYEQTLLYARAAIEEAPDDENAQPHEGRAPIWTIEETERFRLSDTLKDWVRDELAPDLGASFAADLLGYALDLVEWHEIADAWIESARED